MPSIIKDLLELPTNDSKFLLEILVSQNDVHCGLNHTTINNKSNNFK